PRHCNGHVGLRLLAEVDRAEVGLAGHRLLELRVAGKIGVAADDIHGQSRYAQLLMTRRIDMAYFCNGGNLAKEPQRVQPPLIERNTAWTPRRLSDPRKIMLKLADELFDP